MKNNIDVNRILQAPSFDEFIEEAQKFLDNTVIENLDENEKSLFETKKLNMTRVRRILKTYTPSQDLESLVNQINFPQVWMIITEDWCGDSAQNSPAISKIASLNPLIKFRIIKRDENLDIMDQYLTNGVSRSIPKLVAFNKDGNELFQWGPRPSELLPIIEEWKSEDIEKPELIKNIHLWYSRNRAKALENDFINILKDM